MALNCEFKIDFTKNITATSSITRIVAFLSHAFFQVNERLKINVQKLVTLRWIDRMIGYLFQMAEQRNIRHWDYFSFKIDFLLTFFIGI